MLGDSTDRKPSNTKRGKLIIGTIVALMAIGTAVVAFGGDDESQGATSSTGSEPGRTAAQQKAPVKTEPLKPKVEKKLTTETKEIPYEKTTVEDASLEKGKTTIKTSGANGLKTLTYETTITDGTASEPVLIKEDVTVQPVTEVTAVGTKVVQSNCHPNYGGCVPIASDVDCAGGSGNGPAYASGPVSVLGSDVYDLDRDGDGVACE